MPSRTDNDRLNAIEVALGRYDERLKTTNDKLGEQATILQDLATAMHNLSVVSNADFASYVAKEAERYGELEKRVTTLEQNTSFWTKLKNALGDKLFNILVFLLLATLFYFAVRTSQDVDITTLGG